jgi:hypothetical protein
MWVAVEQRKWQNKVTISDGKNKAGGMTKLFPKIFSKLFTLGKELLAVPECTILTIVSSLKMKLGTFNKRTFNKRTSSVVCQIGRLNSSIHYVLSSILIFQFDRQQSWYILFLRRHYVRDKICIHACFSHPSIPLTRTSQVRVRVREEHES